ncbi:caspase family protein [Paractinoplanes brasiliensis]|uniref:Caspase domain-containing protein n=1 Tax=Paractinoplanes brasiliensis TaxID=52695 RepID=A0A4R6JDK4_9ACTN|nr:caspase family protein [Actinoplanes brasiliensis]TDO32616.1 caspase domain-containing protein [Actinoplanes brasiliensis]GID27505.1 hypothetical protein Abr02nite_24880 [Actinoplanes brasiliensis]
MRNLYALLVGIDRYRTVPGLSGCVRDVLDARAHLGSTTAPGTELVLKVLLNEQATRAAVVDGIVKHLGQAGPDDVALFWFAGHGSEWPAPPWAEPFEPTGTIQTLVCADSRTGDVPDLWDKELSLLLDDVSDRAGHVTVVLDSCHSDGATRELREREPAVRTRSAPPPDSTPALDALRPRLEERLRAGNPAQHVVLAACRSFEAAEERTLDRERRGVFTWSLLRAMRRLGPGATYTDLLLAARTEVEMHSCTQTPQARPRASRLLDQPFLGGAVQPADRNIRMRRAPEGWVIDAGALHGLPVGDGLRVGVRGRPGEQAAVVEVRATDSRVEPVAGWAPDERTPYPMVVTSVPTPPITVTVDDEQLGKTLGRSLDVRVVDSAHVPDLRAGYDDGELTVADQHGEQLLQQEYDVEEAATAIEHIGRWLQVWHRRNDASALGSPVRVEVLSASDGRLLERDASGEYVVRYAGGKPPEILIRLRNTADRPLYCALLDLTPRFKVDPVLFPGDFVAAGRVGHCLNGRRIKAYLPPGVPVAAGAAVKDRLKLFVAEEQFGVEPFVMPALPATFGVRGGVRRDLADAALPAGHDWTTDEVSLRIEVPR